MTENNNRNADDANNIHVEEAQEVQLEEINVDSSPPSTPTDEPRKQFELSPAVRLAIYCTCTILIMGIAIIVCLSISVKMPRYENRAKIKIFPRESWTPLPVPDSAEPLRHPVPVVIMSHTRGRLCVNFDDCSETLHDVQDDRLEECSDIGDNFLIGGDGNIYVGRGWDVGSCYLNDSVSVGFMGNFKYDHFHYDMISALNYLLDIGVGLNKTTEDHQLVGFDRGTHQNTSEDVYETLARISVIVMDDD